jgi:hypothetical protein
VVREHFHWHEATLYLATGAALSVLFGLLCTLLQLTFCHLLHGKQHLFRLLLTFTRGAFAEPFAGKMIDVHQAPGCFFGCSLPK